MVRCWGQAVCVRAQDKVADPLSHACVQPRSDEKVWEEAEENQQRHNQKQRATAMRAAAKTVAAKGRGKRKAGPGANVGIGAPRSAAAKAPRAARAPVATDVVLLNTRLRVKVSGLALTALPQHCHICCPTRTRS